MGAQAHALLAAARQGAPLGAVPPAPAAWDGRLALPVPPHWDLAGTALLHGGVGLAPTAWDGRSLHLRLPHPVRVDPDLAVHWQVRPPDPGDVRRVLALDDDPSELWAACDRVPVLAGLRPRVLRSATVWQDLVGALASTRTSYRGAQAMLRALVAGGPFPGAAEVLDRDLAAFGHRAPWLRRLAERVAGGEDPEALRDPARSDAEVDRALRDLPGLGPFSAAQVAPLLGRPRPLVLDGWLRERLGGAGDAEVRERFAAMGRWAGTGAWLAAAAPRAVPG